MRDYLVAYGMSRPTYIRCRECNTPMLTLDDFDLGTFTSDDHGLPTDIPMMRDVSLRRRLAVMCIEQAKLCRICHNYFEHQDGEGVCDRQDLPTGRRQSPNSSLHPEVDVVTATDRDLALWLFNLPEEVTAKHTAMRYGGPDGDIVSLHCNLLHMLYNTAIITLHRRHIVPSVPSDQRTTNDLAAQSAKISREKVLHAANQITSMCQGLYPRGLFKVLPVSGMTCILITTIIHLLHIKFGDHPPSPATVQAFSMFMDMLGQLREKFSYLEFTWRFLDAALQKANITIDNDREMGSQPESAGDKDGLGNLPGLANSMGTKATNDVPRLENSQLFHLTPPPEGEIDFEAHQKISEVTIAADESLPSPLDARSLDIDRFILDDYGNVNMVTDCSLDMAGRDLPTGYGETLNMYLMNEDSTTQEDGQGTAIMPSLPELKGGYGDARNIDELNWPEGLTGMEYTGCLHLEESGFNFV